MSSGPVAPNDAAAARSGAPDVLVCDRGGYVAVNVKHHRSINTGDSGLLTSTLAVPTPSAATLVAGSELAHPKRGRWHLHFTPTSSSWLNIIERWFKELTDRRLRRGVFTSVADLIDAIEIWAEHWNHDPEPFIWHKTAEEIITKVRRGRAALHQIKSATHH